MEQPIEPPESNASQAWGIRNYEFFCLAAILVLALSELLEDYGTWCLLTLLVGIGGILGRWSAAPILLLSTQVAVVAAHLFSIAVVREAVGLVPFSRTYSGTLMHVEFLIQSAAFLAYCAGHYRLQGLVRQLLPADPPSSHRPPAPQAGVGAASRRLVQPVEFVGILVAAVGWSFVAQLVWLALPEHVGEVSRPLDRFLVLCWLIGIVVLVAGGLIGYQSREQARPEAARLYLQDILWQETRGEQRRHNRWLAWARLRFQRRKDTP